METQQILTGQATKTCRICLDSNKQKDIISPCLCRGGSEYVHRTCLDNWRSMNKGGRGFSYCEVCQFQYAIQSVIEDPAIERRRLIVFYLLVMRDIFFVLLLWQALLIGITFAIQAGDKHSLSVRHLFPASMSSLGAYYVSSLIIFFALLGLIGLMSTCISSSNHSDGCNCTGLQCYCIGSQCNNCGGSGGGGGGDAGAVILVILLIILIAFAILGLFVGFFLAIRLIKKLGEHHTKRLWMRQEAKKYIVKDFQGRRHELTNGPVQTSINARSLNMNGNDDIPRVHVTPSAPIQLSDHANKNKESATKSFKEIV